MNYTLYKSIKKDAEGCNTVSLISNKEGKTPESFLQVFKKVDEFKTIKDAENFIGGKFISGCGLKMVRIKY